jgi:hypothetical protein
MATCYYCNQEMASKKTRTCTGNKVVKFPDGEKLPAMPYISDDNSRCGDCYVAPGGFHHPGCDMEDCPRCGGQLISCGCLDDEEE